MVNITVLAQSVEREAFNLTVTGSSPVRGVLNFFVIILRTKKFINEAVDLLDPWAF